MGLRNSPAVRASASRYNGIIVLLIVFFLGMVSPVTAVPGDIDNDGISDETEQELAQQYAPILHFVDGERLYPAAVEGYLESSDLKRVEGTEDIMVRSAPLTAENISIYDDKNLNYFLDNIRGTIGTDAIINSYEQIRAAAGDTVYARVVMDDTATIIQYWFFYYFNPGSLNRHEGDWEMIQLTLDDDLNPVSAAYSQHHAGEYALWDVVSTDGTHPHVYVALGSHANYLRPYSGSIGLAHDTVADNGLVLASDDYALVMLGELGEENHPDSQGWIAFAGYWGDYGDDAAGILGQRGPLGPAYSDGANIWQNPVATAETLSEATAITLFLNALVSNFAIIFITLITILAAYRLMSIVRTYRSVGIGPRVSSLLYITGPNLTSIGNILMIAALAVLAAALFQPWYTVDATIATDAVSTDGQITILAIDGIDGVVLNWFMADGPLQLFTLALPFWIILGAGIALFILSTVGIDRSARAGAIYVVRGVRTAIPILIIIATVVAIGSLVTMLAPIMISDVPSPVMDEAVSMLEEVSASPFSGEATRQLTELETAQPQTVTLSWGMGSGAHLLMLSSALAIIGGILLSRSKRHFFGTGDDIDMPMEF